MLVFAMVCSLGACSGEKSNPKDTKEGKEGVLEQEVVKWNYGTSGNVLVTIAEEKGYFEDAGLDVELEIFATGAPINEAMAAGELDVAVSGMASIYALGTGMYTYIGDGVITTGGESIYVREDSDIAKAGADEDGIIGSAETLKGAPF